MVIVVDGKEVMGGESEVVPSGDVPVAPTPFDVSLLPSYKDRLTRAQASLLQSCFLLWQKSYVAFLNAHCFDRKELSPTIRSLLVEAIITEREGTAGKGRGKARKKGKKK